jgi:hypothetical protein
VAVRSSPLLTASTPNLERRPDMPRHKITPAERIRLFWSRVRLAHPDRCWLWTASVGSHGYGMFQSDTGLITAPRYAWTITYGPVPDGLFVLHTCDVRRCVNPHHLWLGTQADNVHDCMRKGRWVSNAGCRRGADFHTAKLTEADVVEIRRAHAAGSTYKVIAAMYGIDRTNVGCIVRRQTWKHVA